MNVSRFLQKYIVAGLIVLFLTGCAAPTPTPTPTFPPSPQPATPLPLPPTPNDAFTGRLIVNAWTREGVFKLGTNAIYELSINPSTGKAEFDLLFKGDDANISPDNSYIIYNIYNQDSNETDVLLYDLETRADRFFAKGRAECVQWSPNSEMFSAVIDGVLYVYDLSSTSMIIYEAPSAEYIFLKEVRGKIECDHWIGADRFVFQRYKGLMPGSITIGPGRSSPVAASTTTLAILGIELALVDSPKRWYVLDVCMNGSIVLLNSENGVSQWDPAFPGDVFLSETFHDFKDIVPRALNNDLTWNIGFIPNSATCELYAVYSHTSDSVFPRDIFYIDPNTLDQHFVYTLKDEDESRSADIVWSGDWIGDPNNGIIAVSENDPQTGYTRYISIINLSSGNKTVIANSQTKGRLEDSDVLDILAWLP